VSKAKRLSSSVSTKTNGGQRPRWASSVLEATVAVAATRTLLIAVGLVALSWHTTGDATTVTAFHRPHPGTLPVVQMWVRWDAEWYLQIAAHGYAGMLPGPPVFDMRPNFFPLYPLAIRLTTRLTGSPIAAGLAISNVALVGALILLHQWTWRRIDRSAARGLVWLYVAVPTSFFLSAVYAEALLLACLALTWWALDGRRWFASGVLVAAAALCRPVGIIAAPAALLAAARDARWTRQEVVRRAIAIAAPIAVAVVAYALFFAYAVHNPRAALRTETLTRAGFRWPWTTLSDAWHQGLDWYSYDRGTLDWTMAVMAIALLPFVFATLDAASTIFTVLMVLFPLTSGLYSYSRLLLPAFPLFVVIAARLPWRVLIPLLAASLILQAWLFWDFVNWGWVA
jgi:hypothetical protein